MIRSRIAVLITCHNRKAKTLACLQALFEGAQLPGLALEVHLVDDGSTDGTREAISDRFPSVRILEGDGSLFWGGGMRMAFHSAQATAPDAYLWLNDDTLLFPDGLKTVIGLWDQTKGASPACLIIGSTRSPESADTTYGGVLMTCRWIRPEFKLIEDLCAQPISCDTMNGNCVLISAEAAVKVGEIDPRFPHGMADYDYGLRAREAGIPLLVAPGWVGVCARNPPSGGWRDAALPIRSRYRKLISIKGLPPRAWMVFCFRHMGWYAPVSFLSPYLRLVLDSLQPRSRG